MWELKEADVKGRKMQQNACLVLIILLNICMYPTHYTVLVSPNL